MHVLQGKQEIGGLSLEMLGEEAGPAGTGELVVDIIKYFRMTATKASLASLLFMGFASGVYAGSLPSSLMCSNPGSASNPVTTTSINANSCTDFSYSMVQGANDWQYGYYALGTADPATYVPGTNSFQQMGQALNGYYAVDFSHYWTSMDAFGAHPNSPDTDLHNPPYCVNEPANCGTGKDGNPSPYHVEQWAVRQFDIPTYFQGGSVDINVSGQKDPRDIFPGQNTDILVFLTRNGAVSEIGSLLVPSDASVVSMPTLNLNLLPGDIIDFALTTTISQVNGHTYTTDYSDGTFELITLTTVAPEPASFALLGVGLAALGGWRMRKHRAKRIT